MWVIVGTIVSYSDEYHSYIARLCDSKEVADQRCRELNIGILDPSLRYIVRKISLNREYEYDDWQMHEDDMSSDSDDLL